MLDRIHLLRCLSLRKGVLYPAEFPVKNVVPQVIRVSTFQSQMIKEKCDMRKQFSLSVVLLMLVTMIWSAALLVPVAAAQGTAPDCTKPDVVCVGLVTDVGKVDDKSFNQSAWEGLQKAKADGDADWIQYIETTDSKDYDKNIATFADAGYDVIVTSGFNLTDPTYAAAKKYPNIVFLGTDQFLSKDDNHPDWPLPNLVGLVYNEDQSGFLVGALGAMLSKSHKLGAVAGTA